MKCEEIEELIYTYHEISDKQQEWVDQHMLTCEKCKLLFDDMMKLKLLTNHISLQQPELAKPSVMLDKINARIQLEKEHSHNSNSGETRAFVLPIARYSLAAVSAGLLIFFMIEFFIASYEPLKNNLPLTESPTVILDSKAFKRGYKSRQKSKMLFESCRNKITHLMDEACVKQKIEKLNF